MELRRLSRHISVAAFSQYRIGRHLVHSETRRWACRGGAAAPSRQFDRLLLPLLARGWERAADQHPSRPGHEWPRCPGEVEPRDHDRSDAGVEMAHLSSNSSRGGRAAAKVTSWPRLAERVVGSVPAWPA